MAAEARRELLGRLYYDPRSGFGGAARLLKQARARDASVKKREVEDFLREQRLNFPERRVGPQRGANSFVPPEAMHQLQFDLADMERFGPGPYPYALVAIDAFSKKMAAVPVRTKRAAETADALDKVVR